MRCMVGKRDLRVLRDEAGLTRMDVMHALGLSSDTTVRNWETARNEPSLNASQWIVLCNLYGIAPQELADAVAQTQLKKEKTS
jgi:DNA-binding transcriptional regulator YiaG